MRLPAALRQVWQMILYVKLNKQILRFEGNTHDETVYYGIEIENGPLDGIVVFQLYRVVQRTG